MVVEENFSYEQVIGSSSMPYLNSLAQKGALATQYYANVHPSLGNYFELTSGAINTLDDNTTAVFSNDNLVRELNASGHSWKAYAEDIPAAGYMGADVGNYLRHHNPFVYYSDVANDATQQAKVVPFTTFASDLASGALPDFSFVVPSKIHDAHSCATPGCADSDRLSAADQWLQSNIGPLLANAQFQSSGALFIVFDESILIDVRHLGGRVPLVVVGPHAKAGVQSSNLYQHQNTLKTVCTLLSLPTCPGDAAGASSESDLVQ